MIVDVYIFNGEILEEERELTLSEISRACSVHAEWVISLVDEGILEPVGDNIRDWRFSGANLKRALAVQRLQQDLGVNLAGSALVLELRDQITTLRNRLATFEHQASQSESHDLNA